MEVDYEVENREDMTQLVWGYLTFMLEQQDMSSREIAEALVDLFIKNHLFTKGSKLESN